MMGLAHSMIAAGTHDRRFLRECCEGWDELEAYLTGARDGLRRDAAWAAAICDVDAAAIEALAAEMTSAPHARHRQLVAAARRSRRAAVLDGRRAGRHDRLDGSPGRRLRLRLRRRSTRSACSPTATASRRCGRDRTRVTVRTPVARIADLLLEPGREIDYDGRRITFPDVRLVYWCGGNPFHHHQDLNRLARAWRRPETVIVHESWWNPIARFADIVFPAATALERNDVAAGWADSWISAMHQAVEPPGEVRTDYETLCALAERLGLLDAFSEGRDGGRVGAALLRHDAREPGREGRGAPGLRGVLGGRPGRDCRRRRSGARSTSRPCARIPRLRRCPRPRAASSSPRPRSPASATTTARDTRPGWSRPSGSDRISLAASRCTSSPTSPRRDCTPSTTTAATARTPRSAAASRSGCIPTTRSARGISDGDVVRVFNDRGACLAGAVLDANLRRSVRAALDGRLVGSRLAGRSERARSPWQPQRADAGQGHLAPGAGARSRRRRSSSSSVTTTRCRRSRRTRRPSCSRPCREGRRSRTAATA